MVVSDAINAMMYAIQLIINGLSSMYIDGANISITMMITFSMVLTIILWIIGGMIRHNGNS